MTECDRNYPSYTPLLNDDSIVNDKFLQQLRTMREEVIKKDETQKTAEAGKLQQAKGRNSITKKLIGKDMNYKRTQSLLVSNGKKMSKGRPSR